MYNQFIPIFLLYYIIFTIHIFQHIHFYQSYFSIYYPKLVSCFLKYSYNTITITELINHFGHKAIKSHISKLLNFQHLPEVFQHARTAGKNTQDYYHISNSHQGYDALSFNKNNFYRIKVEQEAKFITFHEKKTVHDSLENITKKVNKPFQKYSVSKVEGLDTITQGARPYPVDQLEIGTFSSEDFNTFETNCNNRFDLSKFKKPSIVLEDYSDVYVKVVYSSKKSGLNDGTIISDSGFEELKWFYNFLEKNEEMCLYMNDLLDNSPFFPLSLCGR